MLIISQHSQKFCKFSKMDQSDVQKSQLPNTSIDGSPFLSLKHSRLRKKKTQSKLTYLKQDSTKRKKNNTLKVGDNENNSKGVVNTPENCVLVLPGEMPSSADVTSENISGNKSENAVHACPVCWKQFENTGDQMQHMKTCAAKHNLTLKQLLDALDLQTKQIEERKTLGLPCVPATSNVRKITSKKSSSVNNRDDPDLQLGLALSESMKESEEQNHLVEQEIMLEAGLGNEVAANQASLLERFGFTNTRPVLPSIYPRTRPGKTKLKGTPLLLVRTQDDRERLITEKVAILLTTEENQFLIPHSEGDCGQSIKNDNLQSETLFQLQNGECCLWKKASSSPSSRDCDIYYVESLSYIISPSTIKAGSKLKHLSQVPCRLKTPEKCLPTAVGNLSLNLKENSEVFTVSPQDSFGQHKSKDKDSFSINDKSANGEKMITSDSTNTKIQGNLNQFISKFLGDWNNLLNNCHMSDIKIHVQDGEEIFVHELVLFVRCPNILQDVKQANDSVKYIMWDKISFKGALAFLDFIYCGSTGKIDELNNCVDEIVFLSSKYCVEDLCCYLNCVTNEREIHVLSECQDLNSTSPDVNSKIAKPYNPELLDAQTSDFHLVPTRKSQTERSMVTKLNAAKSEEEYPENNYERSDRIIVVYSPQGSDALHESCLSPDPFVDSCDHEVTNTSYTRKYSSPNTQQNIDNLLEALNVDEDEKFHQVQSDNPEQSLTSEILKESPEVEIVDEEREDIYEASTIKKRKLSDNSNSLGAKQICMNDRNSVRKSLLPSFSDEGENILRNEKDEGKINWSQNICKSYSINSVESLGNVSVNSPIHERAEEINVNSREILEVGSTNAPSSTNEVLTIECSSSTSSGKLNDVQGQVADTSTDILGDFCADYEYQNFYGNYSAFYNEKIPSHSKYDTERSVRNSVSKKQMFFEVSDTEEKNKSPFSSPLSVKSLTRGDSPFKFHKRRSSGKKLTRTRSSSDVSVNTDAVSSSSSPISVKCLSQSSIHLKPSHDTNTEKNKVQSVSDAESNVMKPSVSSGWALQSPVTPSTHVLRTPSRSLNSVKRLLEDSFTAELEKHLLERKLDNGGWPCSTPNSTQSRKSGVNKCLQNVKTGDNCVTPMADYSGMDTPMLKRELQKYGLKPLKRKRAKQILRHIYNELHPLVPAQSNVDKTELVRSSQDGILPLSCTVKQSDDMRRQIKQHEKESKIQKDDDAINSTEEAEISSENEVSFPSTQESSSSSQCQFEVLEDPAEDGTLTQIDVSELPVIVRNYIMTNPEFHQQVLLYEPVWLEQLHESLKEKNYKFKLSQLMECLDEECITFRTIQTNKTKKRQKKKNSK